jgi:hypothetical protein
LQTEVPLKFVDSQATFLAFPLQHPESDETAGNMMPLRPLRACLTATEIELILTRPDHVCDLRAHSIEAPDLRGRQGQAIRRSGILRQQRKLGYDYSSGALRPHV